jgi:hypothetical protein
MGMDEPHRRRATQAYYDYILIINDLMAEKGGFEPPLGYYPKHAFQACDLNRSSTSPKGAQNIP